MPSATAPYADVHIDTKGPGDARPTALQILKDEDMMDKMAGKTVFITGCSSGIGVETARAFHHAGADVFMTVRKMAQGETVKNNILASTPGKGKLELIDLDLNSLTSVRAGATDFLSRSPQLNILITNAGIMAIADRRLTTSGHETQFGTNHLGHFLLFQLLKPTLLASSTTAFQSRVVALTSCGHRVSAEHFDNLSLDGEYDAWVAYGQSKTANIHMANQIERLYGARGLHALAVHPGGIVTELRRHMSPSAAARWENPEVVALFKSVEQGAATSVWAAVAKVFEGNGGKYLEDCSVAEPVKPELMYDLTKPGYAPYAYDEEMEKKLWEVSCELVGVSDE